MPATPAFRLQRSSFERYCAPNRFISLQLRLDPVRVRAECLEQAGLCVKAETG